MSAARRLPIGLTIAVAISLVILIGLGTWQVQRLHWKTDLLARIEAARTAAPVSIDEILRLQAAGEAIEWRKVRLTCQPAAKEVSVRAGSRVLIYSLAEGEIAWRDLEPCRLGEEAVVAVERGIVSSLNGVIEPQAVPMLAPPQTIVGVVRLTEPPKSAFAVVLPTRIEGGFRANSRDPMVMLAATDALKVGRLDEFYVSVEAETPQPRELKPSPTPPDIPNRHLEYALTWYGLAGALVAIYAAMLWRRFKAQ